MSISNLKEETEIRNLGFKTALFIDVPNWETNTNTNKFNNDLISAGNTPDDKNKSLFSSLISQDLMKKLEEESPARGETTNFENYFENKYICRKLSFDEESEEDFDCEDSETKDSKQSKKSKDSNSSSEKTNERKSNSLYLLTNTKEKRFDFTKKYPSSMDNDQKFFSSIDSDQQFLKSKENKDFPFSCFNSQKNNKLNSKNEAYFKPNNNTQNNFYSSPTKQYIKNRIIEKISDSKYPNTNKFPNFDVQNVMKTSNSNNKNYTSSNLEYFNLINNNNKNKNVNANDSLFKQNYMNYGFNNNPNVVNNFSNMNQIYFNQLKKRAEYFAKLNEINNNQKMMMNIQKDFNRYQNLNINSPYTMMMIQNNQKFKENNFENLAKAKIEENALKSNSKNIQNPKSDSKKIKRPLVAREGDWVCCVCKNLNFSFRASCNICKISKEENETLKSKQNVNENKL